MLSRPHPIWSTAGSSPASVSMATIQCRMLSGRYRTQLLCSHWTTNKSEFCLLSSACSSLTEDIPHILTQCYALQETREKLMNFTIKHCAKVTPRTRHIIEKYCKMSSSLFCQFLLDCSILPEVISAVQIEGNRVLNDLFRLTRTWIYSLHKERMKRLGRWNIT